MNIQLSKWCHLKHIIKFPLLLVKGSHYETYVALTPDFNKDFLQAIWAPIFHVLYIFVRIYFFWKIEQNPRKPLGKRENPIKIYNDSKLTDTAHPYSHIEEKLQFILFGNDQAEKDIFVNFS